METQITSAKLQELNTIQLYNHYAALEKSIPLLTPESQELAKAELEACAHLRSEKIDRIHYALAAHEDAIERIKKEQEMILAAKKHHEAQINQLKGLVNYLRRSLPVDSNRITGRNYQFTLVKKKDLSVNITSDFDDWSPEERNDYCLQETVRTTKTTVVRSLSGELISENSIPKITERILPDLDAIRKAHCTGQKLPNGVKVQQDYSIRTKRIYGKLDSQASVNSREFPCED
jgi:hypothetical protein